MGIQVNEYSQSDPGYFRIGDVALSIPPEMISINRVENANELTTLRNKYPMIMKSGQARLDVTITWKAIVLSGTDGSADYSQWKDLRRILAIFKAAPFVEVENDYIRKHLIHIDQTAKTSRLAFGLHQLKIETYPDSPDVVQATLVMSLFNFLPYSKDFGYSGPSGVSVDAPDCPDFTTYINAWMKENLDTRLKSNSLTEFPDPPNWEDQDPNDLSFTWREVKLAPGPQATSEIQYREDGYKVDHVTTVGTFWYKSHPFTLSSTDGTDNDWRLYVTSISVMFSNNLAQLPLANYQYPTYQHVGPASTMVSISLNSNDIDLEAGGYSELNKIIDALNSQYFALRGQWKKTKSVHGMQALFVDNQILNMLGVFSLLPKSLTTQTSREATMIEGVLTATQYENIFEEVEAFKVKSPNDTYNSVVNGIVSNENFNNSAVWTPSMKKLYDPVIQFQNAKKARDDEYLATSFFKRDKDTEIAIGSIPFSEVPGNLTADEVNTLWGLLFLHVAQDQFAPSSNDTNSKVTGDATQYDTTRFQTLGQHFPGLLTHKIAGKMSYADYWFLIQSPRHLDMIIAGGLQIKLDSIQRKVDTAANKVTPHPKDILYDYLFQNISQSDPNFSSSLQRLVTDPRYAGQFNSVQFTGPGEDPGNAKHGAYNDLGLRTINLGGTDFNPGMYFKDYGDDLYKSIWNDLNGNIQNVLSGFRQVNTPQGNPNATGTYYSDIGIGDGNAFGIMQRTNLPGYNMSSAFPTFKLFLIEEDNNSVFYCYDDFYSYSSVNDIEIIKYRDKPDTALITITNFAGLLTHKLFDNSTGGKLDLEQSNAPLAELSSDNDTLSSPGDVPTAIRASEDFGKNYMDGFGSTRDKTNQANQDPEKTRTMLKYYALQTGSKIQVRMGFSNNPDKLAPVFSGTVTQIDENNGIMQIMAQSFMLELMDTTDPEAAKTDSWLQLSVLAESGQGITESFNSLISGEVGKAWHQFWDSVVPHRGAAYTNQALFGKSGETDIVIAEMLKLHQVKHFGHWQLFTFGDPYLKGFRWEPKIGSLLSKVATSVGVSASKASNLSAAIGSGYNRFDENLLINHTINVDGSADKSDLSRSWRFAADWSAIASYSIPSPNHTPWQIIKDISRRYPEYILAVKPYGFPYGSDATLVFAHPNDWYYSRLPLLGDHEDRQANNKTDSQYFIEWWAGGNGRERFRSAIKPLLPASQQASLEDTINQIGAKADYEQFLKYLDVIQAQVSPSDVVSVPLAVGITPGSDLVAPILQGIQSLFVNSEPWSEWLPWLPKLQKTARTQINSVRNEVQNWIKMRKTGSMLRSNSSARIKPVRKWHLIDEKSIIHNGIKLNEKIYNTIVFGDEKPRCINESIPSHHRRLLYTDDMMINPKVNAGQSATRNQALPECYAQSFLREEVGKMYQGEILLRGVPDIEPWDILMITDPSTGMTGPVEVDSVIHSFDQEMGYISIVKPRCLILINEAASMLMLSAALAAWKRREAIASGFWQAWDSLKTDYIPGLKTSTNVALYTVAGVTASLNLLFGPPAEIATLGLLAVGFFAMANSLVRHIRGVVVPLSRYGRPWIGGLEGYVIADLFQYYRLEWRQFVADEISPLIESAKLVNRLATGSSLKPFKDLKTPASLITAPVNSTNTSGSHVIIGNSALDRWAEAIRQHEGTGPKDRSTRNNNPGNLKQQGTAGKDAKGFAVYNTWDEGVAALKADLSYKIRHYGDYTILQMMTRYLGGNPNNIPANGEINVGNEAQGNSRVYANLVAKAIGVPISTHLSDLSNL